jgi:hypothetical protein
LLKRTRSGPAAMSHRTASAAATALGSIKVAHGRAGT